MKSSTPQTERPEELFLKALAKALAPLVRDELQAAEPVHWIDQRESQLGPRRHRAIVQERVARGDTEARIIGRRHLLTVAAHEAELLRIGSHAVQRVAEAESEDDDVGAELGLRLVGRK